MHGPDTGCSYFRPHQQVVLSSRNREFQHQFQHLKHVQKMVKKPPSAKRSLTSTPAKEAPEEVISLSGGQQDAPSSSGASRVVYIGCERSCCLKGQARRRRRRRTQLLNAAGAPVPLGASGQHAGPDQSPLAPCMHAPHLHMQRDGEGSMCHAHAPTPCAAHARAAPPLLPSPPPLSLLRPPRRHLPHGFFEKELLGFFSQFGKLTRVRLSRNKKTGKAKHYAFLEFQYPEVAAVAADAMNGYFMFKQKLEVKVRAEIKQRSSLEKRNMLHTALLATQNETSPLPSPLPSPL